MSNQNNYCFGYSYHNKQPVTKSRFQILVLCGMEFSYITFYLFFGNIDKMQDSHFEIWHPLLYSPCVIVAR